MKVKVEPGRLLTKDKRELAGGKASVKVSVQPASSAENGRSGTSGTLSQTQTQTQAATRLFLRRIEKITGAQIVRRGNGEIYPLAFAVEVPDLWSEAADQVYTLRGDLYRKYPAAEIEIEVRGRRESGAAMNEREQEEER